MQHGLAASEDNPAAPSAETLGFSDYLICRHALAGPEVRVAVEAFAFHRTLEIAAGESDEDIGRASASAFALKAIEYFVDYVVLHHSFP